MAIWRGDSKEEFLSDLTSLTLRHIFSWVELHTMRRYKKKIEVTEVYRSEKAHKELLKKLKIDYYPTPHTDGRAVDFFILGGTKNEHSALETVICALFPYGKGRYQTALYHMGTGLHIHLQVKSGTI